MAHTVQHLNPPQTWELSVNRWTEVQFAHDKRNKMAITRVFLRQQHSGWQMLPNILVQAAK